MGVVVPGECITNALQEDKCTWTLSSGWDGAQVWRPMVELMGEDEEKVDEVVDMMKGYPSGDLAPKQAPAPQATMLAVPRQLI